eukprot:436392-Prymnesium_polylepis.1
MVCACARASHPPPPPIAAATLDGCICCEGAYIGKGVTVPTGTVLGPGVRVGAGAALQPFARLRLPPSADADLEEVPRVAP